MEILMEVHDIVVGWATMLEGARSQVRIPIKTLDFFNLRSPSCSIMALELTPPVTETNTKNLSGAGG
jgi:hypothetical protein